jgi:hypothetical protein
VRKYLIILLLLIICPLSYGQEKNIFSNHQLSVDLGSYRNRYLYPITDLEYGSPVIRKINVRLSLRLRSYSTLYFFSKSAYDITPLAEYYFTKAVKPIYFSAGIGLDARIRLVHDNRSAAGSSAEPLVSLTFHGNYKRFFFDMPLWTRFYSNGISFALLPEASVQISKRFSILIRYELSFLDIYRASVHEWRQDCFTGTSILL